MRTTRSRVHRYVVGVAAVAVTAGMTAVAVPTATAAPPAAAPVRAADLSTAAPVESALADLPAAQAKAVAAAAVEPTFDVLVFSKTTGFRHDSIPAGIAAIEELGVEYGFTVEATEDATAFNAANLEQYEAVIWLSTTSDVLDDTQQAAFEDYIQAGGGYMGIHAASDTEYTWPWYGDLVGAYFQSHPAGTPTASIDVEDQASPSSCFLPARWERTDEWYNFQSPDDPVVNGGGLDYSPRVNGNINVIATLDESTYVENDGNATDDDHPIAWFQEFDGGRSFYTGGGHTQASFSEPLFRLHLVGGIQYAAGEEPDACAEAPPTDADFEQVTLAKGVDKVGEPMSISVLPDGRVLHNARDGRIFLTDLEGNTQLLTTVPVYQHDEDGLQSLSVDPNFAENGWVYLYYAPPLSTPAGDAPNDGTEATWETWRGHNVLSRVKMVDDQLDMETEQELLEVEADRGICCHAGGAIDFDAEGNLYLSTGDDSNPFASDGYAPLDERLTRNPAYDAQRSSANTNDLRGKVIRITPDPVEGTYTIPEGNLFAPGTAQTRPEIYAMGFRNPFRMTVDKETGYVYLGEYGPDAGGANPNRGPGGIVEFNQIREAGNFGWPYCTGPNTTATTYNEWDFATNTTGPKFNCANPVNNSPHNTGLTNLPPAQAAWIHYDGGTVTYNGQATDEFGSGGEGPMAGPVYNYDPDLASDVKFPAYFDNHFFAGEWTRGWIRDIAMDDAGDVTGIEPFFDSSVLYAAMDMEFGPDGSLYVLDYGNGGYFTGNENSAVYKINYINEGFRSPTAVATATPSSGQSPLEVQFSSEGSSDPDEGDSIVSYQWDFQNDGTFDSTEANPTFTYPANGEYDARLVVTDTTGRTGFATAVVTVGNTAPTVEMVMPPNGGFFEFGDSVAVDVDVTDPEDGDIDCDEVDLEYVLGHDSHGHPLSSATGCEVTLPTVRDEGHDASANIFGVLNARYTDGGANGVRALTGEDEVVLQPKRKQAQHTTTAEGVATEVTTDPTGGARNLSNINDGSYVSYDPVSFYRVPQVSFRVASAGTGGTIEARLDSPDGPLAGTVQVPVTGGWQTWTSVIMDISEEAQEGSHELFLVFEGPTEGATGLFNLNYFEALGQGVSVNSAPVVTATATPNQGTAPLAVAFGGTAVDYDGDALTYAWDFGVSGTEDDTADTLEATYTYELPGTYTARLTVTDAQGASRTASVVVRALNQCGVQQSDEFDGDTLDGKWQVIDDTGLAQVSDGHLRLPIQPTSMYGPGGNVTDIVVQDAPTGAYEVTAKVTAEVSENYQQAGLRVYADEDNWASVHLISAGGTRDVEFIYENGGEARNNAEDKLGGVPEDFPSTYYVRLISDGANLTAAYSTDGETFLPVGRPASMASWTDVKVGPTALSGQPVAEPEAAFDWIRFDPDGQAAGGPSDEFDGDALDDCRWNAIVRENPDLYEVADGALTITMTEGDLYQDSDPSATTNFILQSDANLPEDYVLETRVSGTMTDGYAQAGLLVYEDDDNFVKLDVIADTGAGRINRVELRSEVGAAIQNPQPQLDMPANVSFYDLRLTKDGDQYTGEVAIDGGDWQTLGTVGHPTAGMDAGLYTNGVQQAGRTATFDYFRAAPLAAENQPPVAADDTARTRGAAAVDVDVLANDTDPDGDYLVVESVTDPANGTAEVNDDGTVGYTPDAGFLGDDTFEYTVVDGNGGSDTATVTVSVLEECAFETPDDAFDGDSLDSCRWDAIVAENPDLYEVSDGMLRITTTPGEIYLGATEKSNLILQPADHAGEDYVLETVIDASGLDGGYSQGGLMVYGSDANYVKLVAISDDGQSLPNRIELRSEVDDVIVGTNPQPELPLTAAQAAAPIHLRLTKAGGTYTGEISVDGGATWTAMPRPVEHPMTGAGFGVFAAGVLQSGDVVSFDSFTVDGEDPDPVNTAPVAVDDEASTSEGTAVEVDVLANDTDADEGDELSVDSVTEPANGTAEVDAEGVVTYTPDDGFTGEDTFDYVVSDGTDTDTGTVTVTVTPVDPENTAPVAVDDEASTSEGTAVEVDVLANDTDADEGDELSVDSVTEPANGTAEVDDEGVVTYTPEDGFTGEDTFDYVVSDGTDTDTGTVTVTVTEAPGVVLDTTIFSAPTGVVRSRTATIRFRAVGPGRADATFECSLDRGAFRPCVSPKVFGGLQDGNHLVEVRAVNEAGADPTPARARWTVDRTGPRITGVKPTGTVRDRTPTIKAVISDRISVVRRADVTLVVDGKTVRNFEYRNGKVTWTPRQAMATRKHAVRVVAVDAAGNRTVKTWTFKVRRR